MAKTLKIQTVAEGSQASGHSSPQAHKPNWVAIAIWGSLAGGIAMRCLELGMRALHHDESIHATFAYQWMDTPDTAYYKYDPTYHGPFLYIITRVLFQLFGVGSAQARLFPLIFGTIVVFTPLFFRRWMGRTAAWAAVLCLAISPLQIYYSRFLAHDMPSLLFAALSAAAFLAYLEGPASGRIWLWVSAGAMGLLFSVKAVSFLYVFIYASGAFLLGAMHRWQQGKRMLAKPALPDGYHFDDLMRHGAVAVGVFCLCYGVIQTSLLHHPQGFVDGLFTRVLEYWWGQHSMERLTGPTTFHLRSLCLHELPVLLIAVAYGIGTLRGRRSGLVWLWALAAIFAATVPWQWKIADLSPDLANALLALKLRASGDLFVYAMAFVFGVVASYRLLQRDQWFAAFACYWTYCALAIYSFAGEKTPWLTVHVLYPMALVAGIAIAEAIEAWKLGELVAIGRWNHGMPRLNRKQWMAVAVGMCAIAYQLRLSYWVNFLTAGEPSDLLSQVHNTKDIKFVVDWMNRVSYETGEKPKQMPITIAGDVVWAFYFYLIENGYKAFTLDTSNLDGHQRFVILDEKLARESGPKLQSMGYRLSKLDHSGWWVPEHGPVTWLDWARYAWNRKPPNPVGLTPLFVYFKPLEVPPVASLAPVPGEKK